MKLFSERAALGAWVAIALFPAQALAVSRSGDDICVYSSGTPIPGDCAKPKLSADGQIMVFQAGGQVFLRTLFSSTEPLGSGSDPQLSADGKTAVWRKSATEFGLYRASGSGFTLGSFSVPGATDIRLSYANALSLDGRYLAYSDLLNGRRMAFVFDRYLGTRTLVSVDAAGNQPASGSVLDYVEISGDGQTVTWSTRDDVFAGPTASGTDVIRRNWRAASASNTALTSLLVNGSYTCGLVGHPSLSANGQLLGFHSARPCRGSSDSDAANDVFTRLGTNASFAELSVRSNGSTTSLAAYNPIVSASGRYVMFYGPDDLSPTAMQGSGSGMYLRDRVRNTTNRISLGGYAEFTGTGWTWKVVGMSATNGDGAISAHDTHYVYPYNEGAGQRLRRDGLSRSYAASVDAKFRCLNSNTVPGQSIYAVGSLIELGGWIRPLALKLYPTGTSQIQTWETTVKLPANTSFQWKCLRHNEANLYWLNSNERKAGDSVDPLLWSATGPGPGGNFLGTTAASGAQTFSGSF